MAWRTVWDVCDFPSQTRPFLRSALVGLQSEFGEVLQATSCGNEAEAISLRTAMRSADSIKHGFVDATLDRDLGGKAKDLLKLVRDHFVRSVEEARSVALRGFIASVIGPMSHASQGDLHGCLGFR